MDALGQWKVLAEACAAGGSATPQVATPVNAPVNAADTFVDLFIALSLAFAGPALRRRRMVTSVCTLGMNNGTNVGETLIPPDRGSASGLARRYCPGPPTMNVSMSA